MPERPEPVSTRERLWSEIAQLPGTDAQHLGRWTTTEVIGRIPDAEWTTMHAGACDICRTEPARLYANGWRCDGHDPAREVRNA